MHIKKYKKFFDFRPTARFDLDDELQEQQFAFPLLLKVKTQLRRPIFKTSTVLFSQLRQIY